MPTRAPFNAYVGNLAFDAVEEDVEVFFQGVAVRFFPCFVISHVLTGDLVDQVDQGDSRS